MAGLVPSKLVHQFDSSPSLQAEDLLDHGPIHYGRIKALQVRTDIGKSQQPFGFCRHSEESPNSSMLVHTCAEQGFFLLMIMRLINHDRAY